jgi:transcriptional regulator with XRE-family HTH domain
VFGEVLVSWRRLRGIAQEELAARSGISGRHLSFLEAARRAVEETCTFLRDALA